MPELPDVEGYLAALRPCAVGQPLRRLRVVSVVVLRSVDPPASALEGRLCSGVTRVGKRIVLGFGDLSLVIHPMIAGRFRWHAGQAPPTWPPRKFTHAVLQFESGALALVEHSTAKRASMHVLRTADLATVDPGGMDVFSCSPEAFETVLTRENRTLKRALTNPRAFDGIGNAYSDEILFAARLSPVRLTRSLADEEIARLLEACRTVLGSWRETLCARYENEFPGPGEVTAFREEFCVHGRYGKPCRVCGKPVQRIRYAENETNYCAACQNEGRLLADRALSRLLKTDWPRTLEELEGD